MTRRPPRRAVQTLDTVAKSLMRARARHLSWRAVAREFGISPGTAIRVAAGYEPKRADIRAALGLPEYGLAPKCAKCGECHVAKRCTKKPARAQVSLYWNKDEPLTLGAPADDYESWKASNAAELTRRVEWAENKA